MRGQDGGRRRMSGQGNMPRPRGRRDRTSCNQQEVVPMRSPGEPESANVDEDEAIQQIVDRLEAAYADRFHRSGSEQK